MMMAMMMAIAHKHALSVLLGVVKYIPKDSRLSWVMKGSGVHTTDLSRNSRLSTCI